MEKVRTYNAHETERMHQVHGAPLASFKARLAAFGIDFIVAFVVFLLVIVPGVFLGERSGLLQPDPDADIQFGLHNWYSMIFVVFYFCLLTYWSNGKTLGKWLFGIRVVSLVHERISLWHSFERSLGYAASALEGGFGFIQYFIHPNRRTVHDRIAETIVVKESKKARKTTSDKKRSKRVERT